MLGSMMVLLSRRSSRTELCSVNSFSSSLAPTQEEQAVPGAWAGKARLASEARAQQWNQAGSPALPKLRLLWCVRPLAWMPWAVLILGAQQALCHS